MPIGTSVFSDNFDSYSNGSNLDTQGNWKKSSDVAYGSTANIAKPASDGTVYGYYAAGRTGGDGTLAGTTGVNYEYTVMMVRDTGTYSNDQYAEVTFTGLGSNDPLSGVGALVRHNGLTDTSRSCYFAIAVDSPTNKTTVIGKFVSGTYTRLATSTALAWADGDRIGLAVSGTELTVYRNGSATAVTATDSSLSSGRPGFFIAGFQSTSPLLTITNYDGGDIGSSDVSLALSGSAVTPGHGTQSPSILIAI